MGLFFWTLLMKKALEQALTSRRLLVQIRDIYEIELCILYPMAGNYAASANSRIKKLRLPSVAAMIIQYACSMVYKEVIAQTHTYNLCQKS